MKVLLLENGTAAAQMTAFFEGIWGKSTVIITEEDLGNPRAYESTPDFLENLRACKEDEFDLVVLGNNQGAGIVKGKCLCAKLREKTIVVSNETLSPEIDQKYRALGFAKRMTRLNVRDYVRRSAQACIS